MLLTALCGAIYGVLAQRMLARYSALTVTMYAMLFGTFLLFPAALVEGLPQAFVRIDGKVAVLILFLGIFGGALGYLPLDIRTDSSDTDTSSGLCEREPNGGNHFGGGPLGGKTHWRLCSWLCGCCGWCFVC